MPGFLPKVLSSRAGDALFGALSRALFWDSVRLHLVRMARRRLEAGLSDAPRITVRRDEGGELALGREHRLVALAILDTVDRLIGRRALSPRVVHTITRLWGRTLVFALTSQRPPAVQQFRAERGCDPPWFLTLSPGRACNLRCKGCYADSVPVPSAQAASLPWPVLDRIMAEAQNRWAAGLFVFSGGEPLLYRSGGKDLLDAVSRHPEALYLMFTNGTLIDRATAQRLARLGNVTPAISVEGLRARTDARRGDGVFDRVLTAMAHLRAAGVPFGISVTVTQENAEEVLSDPFLDLFFSEQGAFYGFLFHHMPIGRACDGFRQVPTPEQRVALWRRTWEVIEARRVFLFDFWNSGPLVQGCVSAGRERGYLYIDWNGKVMPCVFAPYAVANIQQVYAGGGTLDDVWDAPFFEEIRRWQREYGYGQPELRTEGNWLRPCPIRDHYDLFRSWLDSHAPEPEDAAAADAVSDPAYYEAMVAYSDELAARTRPIWEEAYLRRSREL